MISHPVRPNILFLMADQFRWDALGAVGGWTQTPALDGLARSGCLFTNAFANSSECIPSRLSLATGLYPHQFGVDTNRHCQLSPETWNWMRPLRDAGYATAMVGKTHLHPHEGDVRDRLELMHTYGLDFVDETVGPRAAALVKSNMADAWAAAGLWGAYQADVAARFAGKPYLAKPTPLPLELYYDRYVGDAGADALRRLPQGPWFCWISFGGPHEPWDAPEPYASAYEPADMPPPRAPISNWEVRRGLTHRSHISAVHRPGMSQSEVAELRANYAGNVSLIDDEIAKILRVLDARGDADETVIVFTSDHGEMNGDYGLIYKSNFFDPAIRVPLIVRPQRAASRAATFDGLVGLIDVGRTLLDYAGIVDVEENRGRSLRRAIECGEGSHSEVVVEFGGHACLVGEDFKGEFDEAGQLCALFDRKADPEDRHDFALNPAFLAPQREMRGRYNDFLGRTAPVPQVVQ